MIEKKAEDICIGDIVINKKNERIEVVSVFNQGEGLGVLVSGVIQDWKPAWKGQKQIDSVERYLKPEELVSVVD